MSSRRYSPAASDEELILDARHGSREAFDELVHRFRDAMIAVAQQATGSREVAEDVVQDAFLQAFHALPQLQDPAKFAGWLSVITRYRARRVGARDRRYEPTASESLDCLLAHRGERVLEPVDEWMRATEHADVRAAMAQLPPDHEIVVRLYYFDEWSVRQIADHLSVPVTTVKWRLHRGRRLLRLLLARRLELGVVAGDVSEERQSQRLYARGAGKTAQCESARRHGPPVRSRGPLLGRGWARGFWLPGYRHRGGRRLSRKESLQAVVMKELFDTAAR